MTEARKSYPFEVADEEWSLMVPYLTLVCDDAPQRRYPLRELFNGLPHAVRYGVAWRALPHDFPPWPAVYQQMQRWLASGCFETFAQDLRAGSAWPVGVKLSQQRPSLTAGRSGPRRKVAPGPEANGAKRKRGSKLHIAVDTLCPFWSCG